MGRFLSHLAVQNLTACALLAVAIVSGGGTLWGAGYHGWARASFVVGGILFVVAAGLAVYWFVNGVVTSRVIQARIAELRGLQGQGRILRDSITQQHVAAWSSQVGKWEDSISEVLERTPSDSRESFLAEGVPLDRWRDRVNARLVTLARIVTVLDSQRY